MPSPARLLALLVVLAPLRVAPALAADPAPAAPLLHRSSLAAVLAQRGALQLTPDEVKALEKADARLARDQEAARAAQAHPEDAPQAGPGERPPGGSKVGPTSGGPVGGMSGGKNRPPPPSRNTGPAPAELLQQQLDALDTEAFLQAVEAIPEARREKIIDVASRHREQVFEQREREKSR
jgi:hypothetical protein